MSKLVIRPRAKGIKGQPRLKHGHGHRKDGPNAKKRTREYESWIWMREICYNPNHKSFKYFGLLGITVVERWDSYVNFFNDMGPKPKGHTLKLDDPKKPFGPGNCYWKSPKEPKGPRNNCLRLEHDEETLSTTEWMRRFNLPRSTFYRLLNVEKLSLADIEAYAKRRSAAQLAKRRALLGIENQKSP